MKLTYLDNGATTFPKPEKVYQVMDEVNRNLAVNAGRGSYDLAKKATGLIDETRTKMLSLVNGEQVADVIFAPSATIALNMIIGGLDWCENDICFVSPFEHNAVMRPLKKAQEEIKFEIKQLPVIRENMTIDLEKMEYLFSVNNPTKLFITHVSNVTGYILPVKQIVKIAKKYNCKVIIDASQSLGLIDIDLVNMQADFVVFAGHKNMYGPFGIGGFYMRKGEKLNPFIAGGTGSDSLNLNMPSSIPGMFEPSSPNIVAVAGLSAAADVIKEEGIDYFKHEKGLTDYLTSELSKIRNVVMYLPPKDVHVGIVAFNIKGYKSSDVGMILDEDYNIAVRTGYHCAPLIHDHLEDKDYVGVVRASLGRYTTKDDVDRLIMAVEEIGEE